MMRGKVRVLMLSVLFTFSNSGLFAQIIDTTSFKLISRQSFYSSEKSAELLLSIPKNISHNILYVRLINNGNIIFDGKVKTEKGLSRIPVDLSVINPPGKIEAEISTELNTSFSAIKYISKCDLVILPHKANEVKTDRLTGGLIVNGRPFFPFGFYCYSPVYPTLPEEETVRGFNMISPYQKILPETFQERKAYMDRCAQLGMKVHYNLLSVSGGGGVGSKMEGFTAAQKRELLIAEIKTFQDHPALLAWYISDEPTGNKVEPETLEEIYKVIKETDPWHPVSIVFMAPFLSARKYEKAVDIVMADPYPIPDLPASMVGDVTLKLINEFHGKKPVWIVPQVFGGGELWSREPTIQEIRSMTYQSVINGATGIQYFVRHGLNSFPKSVSAWGECGKMAIEIAELTPWLLSEEQANQVQSFSKNIIVSSKLHNGQLVVLAVNKINEPQRIDIAISGIGNSRAKVIFENRTITVNSGIISDQLPSFGSQVYLIEINKSMNASVGWSNNLMKDPGFEDISSTGVPAACYARPGGDRGATYFIDSREHLEGNHSLRIITPKDSNSVTLRFFPINVKTGCSYLLSIWAKSDPEQRLTLNKLPGTSDPDIKKNSPVYVEIALGDYGKASFRPEKEWKQFVTFVTIPEDSLPGRKTNVILKLPSQGVAWFDLLQVIEDPVQVESRK